MWFRNSDGLLIQINRIDFISCKDYYNKIRNEVCKTNNNQIVVNHYEDLIKKIKNK